MTVSRSLFVCFVYGLCFVRTHVDVVSLCPPLSGGKMSIILWAVLMYWHHGNCSPFLVELSGRLVPCFGHGLPLCFEDILFHDTLWWGSPTEVVGTHTHTHTKKKFTVHALLVGLLAFKGPLSVQA